MNDKRKATLAWILFGLIVFSAAAQFMFQIRNQTGEASAFDLLGDFGWLFLLPVVFGLVGALIISRQPRNVIGLLLMLPAFVLAAVPVDAYLIQYTTAPVEPTLPLLGALWIALWGWLLLIMPILFILVLFPTGSPLTPRWRWLIYWGLGISAVFILYTTFAREIGPDGGAWTVPNPIGFIPPHFFDKYIGPPLFTLFPLLVLCCAAALLVRFRRSQGVEREQIKWLLYAGALFAAFYAVSVIDGSISENAINRILLVMTLVLIPLAIGAAILRYHLYDIDIIIRRTLVYGLLTAVLIAIYFGVVLVAQLAFVALTGQESPLAIVISTLIIAALFNPMRKRIQSFIDRRFYRQKYDAALTLREFAQTAREEVDLDQLTAVLMHSVNDTMQPEWTGLWLKPGKGSVE